MTGSPRAVAATVGVLVLILQLPAARAQSSPPTVTRIASLASGSIGGIVRDERGAPIAGAIVSALGARTAVAITDRGGYFELRTLAPGSYVLRAHVSGFVGAEGQVVEVRSGARARSVLALRRAGPAPDAAEAAGAGGPGEGSPRPILAAGLSGTSGEAAQPDPASPTDTDAAAGAAPVPDHDDGEVAWRLRHLRRGVLKEMTLPGDLLADNPDPLGLTTLAFSATPGAGVANIFAGVPLTGQFNLLTTGSFDSPQELFAADNFSRSIAYVSLTSSAGAAADWSMRGALTQGDLSSWFLAGAYTTRDPARHRYDVGLSYSTQRYDGGNPAALRDVSDGSRNVGAVYGFDTVTIVPAVTVTYGARFSRYDYLPGSGFLSPRVELSIAPTDDLRVNVLTSSRALAPGAEEFLPPMGAGLWLPPQRTFSAVAEGRPLEAERTRHLAVQMERDFGASTVSIRAFQQRVDGQLVTMFGLDVPGAPRADLGHYFVGTAGDMDATGWAAAFRTTLASRVHGSVEYSSTSARWEQAPGADYLLLLAPSMVRPASDRVHDVSTAVETNVPETATRILVVARLSRVGPGTDRPTFDGRFDVQVHQSLPFMDFSTARWEMLLAVKNAFHDAAIDSSVYDELLVLRPPKRIVGGLTLRF